MSNRRSAKKVLPCPVKDCDWWTVFGGYLEPTLRQAKSHVESRHRNLSAIDYRRTGGIVDRTWGDALQSAIGVARHDGGTSSDR